MQTPLLSCTSSLTDFSGLRYQSNFLSVAEEADLLRRIETLPFERFKFRQYLGNRRVCAFGHQYDYTRRSLEAAPPLPEFLDDLRVRVAAFAGLRPEAIVQEQVLEYAPGAGIGWHRDKAEFDVVIGISLGAPATMRFRHRDGAKWARAAQPLEPRSIYVMSGAARHEWEHSITAQSELRYALMFRSLA